MDAKLLYWTAALANLALVTACASLGVRRIRRRDARGHRRMMLSAASLVALFLASYVLKVWLLGKEDRSAWGRASLVTLYVHESCILVMLIGGALAAARARRFRRVLDAFPFDADRAARSDALALARRQHRRAGWAAVVGGALAFVTATLVLGGMYARADEPPKAPAPPAASAPATPESVPIPDVAARYEELLGELREIERRLPPDPAVTAIESSLPARRTLLRQEARGVEELLLGGLSFRDANDLEDEWLEVGRELARWREVLTRRASSLQEEIERLAALDGLWERTLAGARAMDAPAAVVARIEDAQRALARSERAVRERQAALLTLQGRVSEEELRASDLAARLRWSGEERRSQLLRPDRPALWRDLGAGGLEGASPGALPARVRAHGETLTAYVRSRGEQVAASLLAFLAFAAGFWLLDRRVARWTEGDPALPAGVRVFGRPLSAALIATAVSFPPGPRAVRDALAPLLVIPLYRLVSPLLDRSWRRHRNAVFGLFVADRLRDLLAPGLLLERLLMTAELVAAIAVVLGLSRTLGVRRRERTSASLRGFTAATRLALAVLSLALLAQVFGYVGLSELLGEGVVRSGLVGLGFFAAARIAQLTLAVLLGTQRARAAPPLREIGPTLLRWGPRAIAWLAAAAWAFLILDYFGIRARMEELLVSALTTPLELGTVSLSLGQVLGFLVTLLAALLLSASLRTLLGRAVFPRLQLRRGIPQAITATLHYAVLLVGFLLALGAAGVDFSRFTLLAGAFGVGLGFGLQNVVSNFVAGLILLYERPIQIGDSVEVAGVQGEVQRIGIRSSTLRTGEGAEVIVPNARLIENQVVNWTLSDQDRRIELRVGVAYGTEPRRAVEILLEVAGAHPELIRAPQPQALFLGFGESSLDFQLLVWTSNFAGSARIKSELGLAVYEALRGAGIEMPVPQRELRLRGAPAPSGAPPGQPEGTGQARRDPG